MREIVLDTETTGLDYAEGHRLVEVGAVEVLYRERLGETFHRYVNPKRHVPQDATAVHGLTQGRLFREPVWEAIEPEFLAFVGDSPCVAHNAKFDRSFLPSLNNNEWTDTYKLAPTSLDQLAKKYGLEADRKMHGALKDALLLAHVYIRLRRPTQASFALQAAKVAPEDQTPVRTRLAPLPARLTEVERNAHKAYIKSLGAKAIWLDYLGASQ